MNLLIAKTEEIPETGDWIDNKVHCEILEQRKSISGKTDELRIISIA